MMRYRPATRAIYLTLLPAAAFVAVFLAGCGQKIEKNPVFRDQMRLVDRLDEDTKVLTRQIDEMSLNLKTLRQQVAAVQKNPQAATGQIRQFSQRLASLEKAVATSNQGLSILKAKAEEQDAMIATLTADQRTAVDQFASLQAESRRPSPQPASSSKQLTSASLPADVTTKLRGRITRSSQSASRRREAPLGGYQFVQAGESLQEIASKNRISVGALLAANRIPPGRSLYAGQQIFVPAGD